MKKKIFFLLPVFSFGGAGQSILRISSCLNKKNYSVCIISLGKCFYKKNFEENKIKVFEIKKKKILLAVNVIRNIINNDKSKKKILISNIHYTNVISLIFLRDLKDLKIIVSERTSIKELFIYFGLKDYFKKMIIKILIRIFYKNSDKIITNSNKCSKDLKNFIHRDVETIFSPSYYDIRPFKKKREGFVQICTIGRLSKEKNIKLQIKILARLKKYKYKLFIVGDGEEKERLKKLVNKLNMKSRVKFLNYRKNIETILKNSDLYLNTSYFEGFPNAIVEAINYKVPVICSDSHGGIHDILKRKKFGEIFKLDDEDCFLNLIRKFFINQKFFTAKLKNSKKHLQKFNTVNVTKKYEKILDQL